MNDHTEPWKNCPVSMPYNIAETDKAYMYDKCHHILNHFKSNETSNFYQMDQSIFAFVVVGYCFQSYSNFNRPSCKQTVEILKRHCSLWRHPFSMSNKKNTWLIWVKYFCCICYSHQLYCFFIRTRL